ncbi:MAG TPA: penicillin-insensitive murein endopeptidase, partial [Labilithrix sp.]|nr:penicillin-insensitive murein endopeptidase [Labilithrix sp.]
SPLGRSIGSPTDGHLIGGARVNESSYLRIVPVYGQEDARWGLEPLVGMIDRAARAVRKQFPDAVLSVGHLSRPGGGEINRHASHESGRDADIGFYVSNQRGKTIYADHFVAFKGDGSAPTWPGARFDDAKNWALVAMFCSDPRARVSHIFVATPLRARLLQYAQKIGAPHALRVRAAELMAQPRGALPHDDHFHVRIACPPGMDKCIERPVARKPPRTLNGKAALASAEGAAPHASARATPPAHAPSRAPVHAPPPHKPVIPRPVVPPRSASEEAESKNESLFPSLAPIVPGLDSAVIPAPLAGTRQQPSDDIPPLPPPQTPTPSVPPIDDPDGVLERP